MAVSMKFRRLIFCYLTAMFCMVVAQFEYHNLDAFDDILNKIQRVTENNCHIKPRVSNLIYLIYFLILEFNIYVV